MSGPKRRSIEAWLAALEARLPKPTPAPIPPEAAAAFHDAALAVHDRTGSAKLARRAGLVWSTAVAADLAAVRDRRRGDGRGARGARPAPEGRGVGPGGSAAASSADRKELERVWFEPSAP
jgi:hypothetical protein